MAKVLLKVNGENIQYAIEQVKVKQSTEVLKKIKEILKLMKEHEGIAQLIDFIFAKMDKETGEVDEKELDTRFMIVLINSFEVILDEVPDKAKELISVMSGIDMEVLDEQPLETMFDVFDAVMEENDIIKLVARAKKSLDNLSKILAMRAEGQK